MKGYIYIHTSPSGKSYVGQTYQKPHRRWGIGGRGYNPNTPFGKAIKKYGWNAFEHRILDVIDFDDVQELNQLEEDYMILFNTLLPDGYNLMSFGRNRLISERTRKKLIEAKIGYKSQTAFVKGHIPFNKGKTLSDEHKKALKEAARKRTVHGHTGVKHSNESKKKMSIAAKKRIARNRETQNNSGQING
jgi:group I intron endonuclease